MKRNGFTLLNLIILGLGILFIAASRRPDFIRSLVFFTGIAFIVPGIFNIFTLLLSSDSKETDKDGHPTNEKNRSAWTRFTAWTVSIAAVALGAMMCFSPETFHVALIYIFACFIFIGGLYHIYMLLRGMRPATYPLWTYLFPTALVAIAAVLIFVPSLRTETGQATVALLTGIAMILFAITSFFESVGLRAYTKRLHSAPASSTFTPDKSDSNTNNDPSKSTPVNDPTHTLNQ